MVDAAAAAAGVPDRVAVPLPLSVKLTPGGNDPPPTEIAGFRNPVVVTVKLPGSPALNVVLAPLVIAGGSCTVRAKLSEAFGATPLAAVIVTRYGRPRAASTQFCTDRVCISAHTGASL